MERSKTRLQSSPLLFTLVLDNVIKEWRPKLMNFKVGYHRLQAIELNEIAFADDIVLIVKSEQALQNNLNVCVMKMEKRAMKLNVDKTKAMVISKKGKYEV